MRTRPTAAKTSRATFRLRKHVAVFDGSEPEAVGVGIVVAGSSAVALDEWSAAEFLQAGTRGGQSLSRALGTSASVLQTQATETGNSSGSASFHPHTSNIYNIYHLILRI